MIYLDNAATTRVNKEVLEAMLPYFGEKFANPSASHGFGNLIKKDVEEARKRCSMLIGAKPEEIFFTSGGTESDNTAIFSRQYVKEHIVTTKIEHDAVLKPCMEITQRGIKVTFLEPGDDGIITEKMVKDNLQNDTGFVSVMTANNEIGTISRIREIGRICRERGIIFHTDAVQAFGHIPIDVNEMNIDMLSASGHKLGAPKGVGLLYIRDGLNIPPYLFGGGQEMGLRSGTLNVPSIVGFGKAAELALWNMPQNIEAETKMRDHLIDRLLTGIPDCRLNGSSKQRLPGNVNVSIPGINGKELLDLLSKDEIYISTGSACSSKAQRPSHVLKAMGLSDDMAAGSIRITLNYENTQEEIDYTADKIIDYVEALRLF